MALRASFLLNLHRFQRMDRRSVQHGAVDAEL
jgi:hypothetical protein